MSNRESLFIKCQCGGCSVIEFNHEPMLVTDNQPFYISLWGQHPGTKMNKKERIRWCEHVMKTGYPWADHTIVSNEDAQRIVDFLTQKLTQYGNRDKKTSE